MLVDCETGEASLAGIVGPGGVLAAALAPDEELLVFVTGGGVLLGMTPGGLEVLYEVRRRGEVVHSIARPNSIDHPTNQPTNQPTHTLR